MATGVAMTASAAMATAMGAISNLDIAAIALCANGADNPTCNNPTTPMILDTDGDLSITALEIGGIVAVVNGSVATTDLQCGRDLSLPCEAPNCFSGCASAPPGTQGCP